MKKSTEFKIGKFYLVLDGREEQTTLLEPVKFTKDSILLKPQFGFDNQLHSPLSELSKESTSEEEIGYDAGYEMSIEETYQQIIRELGFIK